MKKIICLFLTLATLLALLCSCGDNGVFSPFDKKWIVEIDGEKISSEIYAYYVYCTYEMYEYYGYIDEDTPLKDQTIPVAENEGDEPVNVPAAEQINRQALNQTLYLYELKKQFEAAGLNIDKQTEDELKELVTYEYESYKALFEANGISEDTVLLASTGGKFSYMEDALFESVFGKGGTNEVSEQELNDYYKQNYVCYAYISRKLLDSQGVPLDEEDKDVIRAELKQIADKVKNGSQDLGKLALNYITESAEDSNKGGKGVSTILKGESDLMNYLDGMAPNEVSYVEQKNIGYVIKKYDLEKNDFLNSDENRLSVLKGMRYEEWTRSLSEDALAEQYKLNGSAFRKYGINNLKSGDE